MRTIKFRGIDTISGEMVYGDLVQQELSDGNITTAIVQTYATYDVKPESVGQFTGLYDKNGTGIYEGDILKVHYYWKSEVFGVVTFNYCRFYIDDDETFFRIEPKAPMSDMFGREYEWEVIGNIHDNPELMEAAAK